MDSHVPLPQSPQSPLSPLTPRSPPYTRYPQSSQYVQHAQYTQYAQNAQNAQPAPQHAHLLSPRHVPPYSPPYASPFTPTFAPPPFQYAQSDANARRPSPAPTSAFVTFRIVTMVLSVPLLVFTARLLHDWPSHFGKTAIGIAAAVVAIVSDAVVLKLFFDRSRYFAAIVLLDIAGVILSIAAIVEFVRSGATDGLDDDAARRIQDQYATDRLLGLAFSFIVCGVRIFSAIINSIVACMMRSQGSARPRIRSIHIVPATQDLY